MRSYATPRVPSRADATSLCVGVRAPAPGTRCPEKNLFVGSWAAKPPSSLQKKSVARNFADKLRRRAMRLRLKIPQLVKLGVNLVVDGLQPSLGVLPMPDIVAGLHQLIPQQAAGWDWRARVRDGQQVHEDLVQRVLGIERVARGLLVRRDVVGRL